MLEVMSSSQVQQRTHGDEIVILHKEVIRVNCKVPIWLVRKHLIGGATKPAIVLVHGFAQNRYSWHTSRRSMSAWFAHQGYDVFNLEMRGHGRSRNDGQLGMMKFEDYLTDIHEVARALPEPAFWIGHSLGGGVLYGAAATMNPLICRGVIGIGAVFRFGNTNPAMRTVCSIYRRILSLPYIGRVQLNTKRTGLFFAKHHSLLEKAGKVLPISGWGADTVEADMVQERIIKGFDWTSLAVWKAMCDISKNKRFPYEQEWIESGVPLLCILGDKDHLLPVEDGKWAYELSSSDQKKLMVFDDYHHDHHWGHLDLILGKDAPRFVWKSMMEWIDEVAHSSNKKAPNSSARSSAS